MYVYKVLFTTIIFIVAAVNAIAYSIAFIGYVYASAIITLVFSIRAITTWNSNNNVFTTGRQCHYKVIVLI